MKVWGGHAENTSKFRKMASFSEDFVSGGDFEAGLAISCCYDYSVYASDAVENIATDKKGYHKCSLCVILCWIHIINNSKKG